MLGAVTDISRKMQDSNRKEEDAILRMLIYIKYELIRNNLDEEVKLMEILIKNTEKTLNERREIAPNTES